MGVSGGLLMAAIICLIFGFGMKSGSHLFLGCLFLLILAVGFGFTLLLWAGH